MSSDRKHHEAGATGFTCQLSGSGGGAGRRGAGLSGSGGVGGRCGKSKGPLKELCGSFIASSSCCRGRVVMSLGSSCCAEKRNGRLNELMGVPKHAINKHI